MRQKLRGGVTGTNQKSNGMEAKTHHFHDENMTFIVRHLGVPQGSHSLKIQLLIGNFNGGGQTFKNYSFQVPMTAIRCIGIQSITLY